MSLSDVEYARLRRPDRTYISKAFALGLRFSRDYGKPTRNVRRVFDEPVSEPLGDVERTTMTVDTSRGGRRQIQLQVARSAGSIRELLIQKVPTNPNASKLETVLKLDRAGAERLIDLARNLEHIPIDENQDRVRVDDALLRDVFEDPDSVSRLYNRDPEAFRRLIADDEAATDIIAVAHRRAAVGHFRELLENSDVFDAEAARSGGPEAVWQRFFEENPWILGVTLAGQLLTAWSEEALEQVVAGFSIAGSGKRTDALLRTNGAIRSLVFAEIKHHRTPLLGKEYRGEAWSMSSELAGGISQLQQTVHLACQQIGDRLPETDEEGAETPAVTSLVRPRSYLVTGHLDQLRGSQGIHQAKHRSFELGRRNLYEPEIITFDELLARAEWHVLNTDRCLGA